MNRTTETVATDAQMTELLERYVRATKAHDVDAMLATRHPDAYLEFAGLGHRIEGRRGLREFFESLFEAGGDYGAEIEGHAFGENVTVLWGSFRSRFPRGFLGGEGGETEAKAVWICHFRDGLFAGDHMYFDSSQGRRPAD